MKKLVTICVAAVVLFVVSGVAQAVIVQQTYTFTGADLINNIFDSEGQHSDGSLKYYEGARQLGPADTGPTGATFLGDPYLTNFNNMWNAYDNEVLSSFNLWGVNGFGGQWGDDYKPLEWVSGTCPEGWTFELGTWDNPPAGYLTDKVPVFSAEADGMQVKASQSELEALVFTVTIKFDTDNMWWGNPGNYVYGANTAPNSLYGLTMGFTSYIGEYDGQGNLIDNYLDNYTGNMMAVPEPASFLLFGAGLVGCMRRRKSL